MNRNETAEDLERNRVARAIAGLEDVIRRNPEGDRHSSVATAVLSFLKMRADDQPPFEHFREALEDLTLD